MAAQNGYPKDFSSKIHLCTPKVSLFVCSFLWLKKAQAEQRDIDWVGLSGEELPGE